MKSLFVLLSLIAMASMAVPARAQGTAFAYQGRLQNNGVPANGKYDLMFTLYTTNVDGVVVAGPVTDSATSVSNGLFTVTIDFGAGAFTGNNFWLDVSVSPAGSNDFTDLSPRQPILPTPYAMMAITASNLLGRLPGSQLTGPINASQLNGPVPSASLTTVPAGNLTGTVPLAQLPSPVLTNKETGVTLTGAFSGTFSGVTNLVAASISPNGSTAGQVLTSSGGVTTWGNANPWQGGVPTLVTNGTLSSNAVLAGHDRAFFLGFITSTANQQSGSNYFTIKLSQAVSTNAVFATYSPGARGTWTNSSASFKNNQGFQLLTTSNSVIVQSVGTPQTSTSYGMFVHVDQY